VYRDAIIGAPRFINPVLAETDADLTLGKLVYSGLVRETDHGVFIPDLAERVDVSPNGLVYTFTLRDNIVFHDGKKLTAHDVVYTMDQVKQNLTVRNAGWQSVEISSPDEYTVVYTLKKPYGEFMRMATIGILPAHIWEPLSVENFMVTGFNAKPIGTGPYRVTDIQVSSSGIPEKYTLKRFNRFILGKPYLQKIIIHTVPNYESIVNLLHSGDIDGTMIHGTSENIQAISNIRRYTQTSVPSTKVFALFMRDTGLLSDNIVRTYINSVINTSLVIDSVSTGKAFSPSGPIPHNPEITTSTKKITLENHGWIKNTQTGIYEQKDTKKQLRFTITTLNNPELQAITQNMVTQLESAGIGATVQVFESSDLETAVLSERKFESFLFGVTVGSVSDLYAFWHSSQRNYPGLNITGYHNKEVDTLLEQVILERDYEKQKTLTQKIITKITSDTPAIFIYNPADIIITKGRLHIPVLQTYFESFDRFNTLANWYTHTDMVWKIFDRD
jgi:peptide/nickel transport system substrate-binding protein